MVNYQEGMIYKIAHRYSPYVYIGSTTNFNRRKSQHKHSCNNKNSKGYNHKVYQTIREFGGWDNFVMVLVAKCPCNDKKELHSKEFEYQQLFDVNMNTQNAIKDPEYNINWCKEYYKKNKESENARCRLYHEKNKEKENERTKLYYEKNKEKILKKQKEKIQCECGSIVGKKFLNHHRKTPRHFKLMSS